MKYLHIAGEPDAIVWHDDSGNSGVIRAGDAGWEAYQQWQSVGNEPASLTPIDTGTLSSLQADALSAINAEADRVLAPITSRYSRSEIDSWPEQCQEARAWLTDHTAHTPLLDAIAGPVDDEAMEALCLKILGKSDIHKKSVGGIIAWRRSLTGWVMSQVAREPLIAFNPLYPGVPHAS